MNILFEPYTLTPLLTLKNRLVMAPMTRRFSDDSHCPIPAMADYYAKRAEAGLIVTEGTIISEDAIGYGNVPGIYTTEQLVAWQKITEAVHAKGGVIFLQLWHCGRVSHPNFHQGRLPISASATQLSQPLGRTGLHGGLSRAASHDDIQQLISDYAKAAKYAIESGFDGIELHGANGYLIDQFHHHCTNQRDDEYGGSPENMSRFCLEIISACANEIGLERIGIRLSPAGHMAEITADPQDQFVFQYLLSSLSDLPIAYVHVGQFDGAITYPELNHQTMTAFIRSHYAGTLIAVGGYTPSLASEGILQRKYDLIAFGRPFIANPDLVSRLKRGSQLLAYSQEMLSRLV